MSLKAVVVYSSRFVKWIDNRERMAEGRPVGFFIVEGRLKFTVELFTAVAIGA